MNTNWIPLNKIPDTRLYDARGQLHQAAQLLAATGISYVPHRADDSHTAMLWSAEKHEFQSQSFGEQFQIALDPADLNLNINKAGKSIHKLELNGITLSQASGRLQQLLEDEGLPKNVFTMKKHYDLPDYPDRWDRDFDSSDTEAFQVLANSYNNAFLELDQIANVYSRAGDLLIWPHHFDLGLLITVAEDEQGNLSKSIGVGMSPGDGSYTAPYYYVTVWPAPTLDQISSGLKSAGEWHSKDWIGMVLSFGKIASEDGSIRQNSVTREYLEEALSVAEALSR